MRRIFDSRRVFGSHRVGDPYADDTRELGAHLRTGIRPIDYARGIVSAQRRG